MLTLHQSPTDPAFVQDPYPFYAAARARGDLHVWADYGVPAAFSHSAVSTLLRDRRFGREVPADMAEPPAPHTRAFYAIEAHSMLEAEPPRHTRLRGLVLRAFTSRRIQAMAAGIAVLCHDLIDSFPDGDFDLIPAFCTPIPVRLIARLLGVPEDDAPRLLSWSHAMVAMYVPTRTRATEVAADQAAAAFSAYLQDLIAHRRKRPGDDLITELIAAEEAGDHLSADELISTCILLLNAGHEATVHSLGNAVKCLLERDIPRQALAPGAIGTTIEELLRFDPPLHMFTRIAYADLTVFGHKFRRGDRVALLLGAANRDPAVWPDPDRFISGRAAQTHASFGGGLHFCVGAPLARLELQLALPILFNRCPGLRITQQPVFADTYHFHGLGALNVTR